MKLTEDQQSAYRKILTIKAEMLQPTKTLEDKRANAEEILLLVTAHGLLDYASGFDEILDETLDEKDAEFRKALQSKLFVLLREVSDQIQSGVLERTSKAINQSLYGKPIQNDDVVNITIQRLFAHLDEFIGQSDFAKKIAARAANQPKQDQPEQELEVKSSDSVHHEQTLTSSNQLSNYCAQVVTDTNGLNSKRNIAEKALLFAAHNELLDDKAGLLRVISEKIQSGSLEKAGKAAFQGMMGKTVKDNDVANITIQRLYANLQTLKDIPTFVADLEKRKANQEPLLSKFKTLKQELTGTQPLRVDNDDDKTPEIKL